jgi:MoaA/NifB/PqqE/SkfB family radical SAM enzyme
VLLFTVQDKEVKLIIVDPKTGIVINSKFHKITTTDDYQVLFNMENGLEVVRGVNGKEDPFATELPLLLDIGIMGHCQNRCAFCYQGDIEEPHMTLENFKSIIDQTKHHVNQVALGGRGDPNKHPHFKEIVEYARKNNVIPNYTTSGINLTDEEVEISKLCGAVAVSDYGNNTTYIAVQKFIDAKIKTNIHLIFTRPSYTKCLQILYGSNPWTKSQKQKSDDLFEFDKLFAVIFLLFKPQGRGANCQGLKPVSYQIEAVAKLLLEERKRKVGIGIDSCLANHIFKYGGLTKIQKMVLDSCEGSRQSAYISPSMKMMPCSYAEPFMGVQITQEQDINYIWNRSNVFKQFRSQLKKRPYNCPAGF